MTHLIEYTVKLEMHAVECAECGISFGIPKDFEERRRKDHATFYCPSGHSNYYGQKSEAFRLLCDNLTKRRLRSSDCGLRGTVP